MPPSWHARSYWIKAKKEALSLIAGGGGGMQQLGDEVEGAALAALVASGAGEAVQTAVASTGPLRLNAPYSCDQFGLAGLRADRVNGI